MTKQPWLAPGPECLTPQQLEQLLEGSAAHGEQAHLDACPVCQSEYALLREFLTASQQPGEAAAVRSITAELEKKRWRAEPESWWERLRLRAWAPTAIAAVAAVLAVAIWLRQPDAPRPVDETEVMRSAAVTLLAPLGELTEMPPRFTWSPVAGATRYTVEVFELDNTPVWKSDATAVSLALPSGRIPAGRMLQWKVTAIGASGAPLAESTKERFRLRAP